MEVFHYQYLWGSIRRRLWEEGGGGSGRYMDILFSFVYIYVTDPRQKIERRAISYIIMLCSILSIYNLEQE